MKAVALHDFGGPEVLEVIELADPRPREGWVVVQVAAATVNPTDTLLRAGRQVAAMQGLIPPFVPGMELAGHVSEVGEGVTNLFPGQAVIAVVDPRRPEGGAQASLVALPAASVVALPEGLSMAEAATIAMNGLTAVKALECLDLPAGGTLLVTGAAGAVGGYAAQIARHRGLRVIADAHESDRYLLAQLGAAVVVPRGDEMVDAVRAAAPDGVDGVIDTAVLGELPRALVREGGGAVSVRGLPSILDPRLTEHAVSVTKNVLETDRLEYLAELAAHGVITPRVAEVLPMGKAAQAHRMLERGGLRGRVVLTFE